MIPEDPPPEAASAEPPVDPTAAGSARAAWFLTFLGCASFFLGCKDVVNRQAGFHPRVIGFAFVVASLLMLFTAAVLFLARANTIAMTAGLGTTVLIGAAAGVGVGLYFAFALWAGRRSGLGSIFATVVAALSFACLVSFMRRLHAPLTATAGVMFVAVLGSFSVYEFWFTQQYVPRTSTVSVNIDVTIEAGPDQGRNPTALVSITATNVSTVRANVLASKFVVTAPYLSSGVEAGTEALLKPFLQEMDPPPGPATLPTVSDQGVVAVGRVFGESGAYLGPDEEVTRQWAFVLPKRCRNEVVRLEAALAFANAEQLRLAPTPLAGPDLVDEVVAVEYSIEEPSVIQRLVNGTASRLLVNYWAQDGIPVMSTWLIQASDIPDSKVIDEHAETKGVNFLVANGMMEIVLATMKEPSTSK